MKCLFAFIIILMSPVSQIFCQSEYLLTESISQIFHDEEPVHTVSIKYMYDDQERLIRSETALAYTSHMYEGNVSTLESYSLLDNEINSRNVEIQNDDGFRLVYSTYLPSSGNELELQSLDSLVRNADNQVVNHKSYSDNGVGFEKESEEDISYTSDGRVLLEETRSYYNGQLDVIRSKSNNYFSDGLIESSIFKTEEVLENASYSDTINFFYDGDQLIGSLLKDYGEGGFYKCQNIEIETEGSLITSTTRISNNSDCSEYTLDNKSEKILNEDIFWGVEKFTSFEYTENDIFEKSSSLDYNQTGIIGDSEILLQTVRITFDGTLEFRKFIDDEKYIKRELVSNNDLRLETKMLLAPNITSQNNLVSYKVSDVGYDNIRIVDLTGQIIMHESIVDTRNTFFTAPTTPGLYFVQLLNGKTPVTKQTKLIVK